MPWLRVQMSAKSLLRKAFPTFGMGIEDKFKVTQPPDAFVRPRQHPTHAEPTP
jgi:hypothetical protein